MKHLFLSVFLLCNTWVFGQAYTSYFTGSTSDISTNPLGGICLMGGATEHDEAMKWFLQRANGGDILVLRTSGSNGYNNYLYSQLGVSVNSVETIVFNNASAANDSYVQQKIEQAEAIWFAGGNQWNYVSYWRNTPVSEAINDALENRNIAIGGTSAGMAIQGSYYFSAENGTVTSSTALANPYDSDVVVDHTPFIQNNYLENVITDTHYNNPDRKGRHAVFLARIYTDDGIAAKGIACNEYTAVCIDENGLASVYGDYPNYPESAYFIQTNCEIDNPIPETCSPNTPLTWNQNGTALRVYKVNGTMTGENSFDLSDWKTGTGGSWENWSVNNGVLSETDGTEINCNALEISDENQLQDSSIFPVPFSTALYINSQTIIKNVTITTINGKTLYKKQVSKSGRIELCTDFLRAGMYFLQIESDNGIRYQKILKTS